ncbi:MAG: FUSC family protein, partial [Pseudolysinimonas sp.]
AGRDSAELGELIRDPMWQASERRPSRRVSALDAPHAPVAVDWRRVGRSLLSVGTQLLVAVVFALIVGQLIDPRHWYWCVLAALVMVFGMTSATASLSKGYRRVLGALVGLPVGLALGWLTHDALVLVAIVALVAIFLQQYVAEIAYGGSIFFLTVIVSVLFGQTGDDRLETLGSRALLTAFGAVIGAAVGFAVLPARAGEALRRHADNAIAEVATTLTAIGAGERDDVVTQAGRVANQRFAELRTEAQSSRRGWPLSRHQRILAEQIGAGGVVARELRAAVHDYRSRVVDQPGFSDAVTVVEAKVAAVRAQLTGTPSLRREESAATEATSPAFGLVRLEHAIDGLAVTLRAG